jgi:hypothetical protein
MAKSGRAKSGSPPLRAGGSAHTMRPAGRRTRAAAATCRGAAFATLLELSIRVLWRHIARNWWGLRFSTQLRVVHVTKGDWLYRLNTRNM